MHPFITLASLSTLAGYAAAEAVNLPGYIPVDAPAPTAAPNLARREDEDKECTSSIIREVFEPDGPSATELLEWYTSQTQDLDACTFTMPASLSSDYVSYASYISNFWEGAQSRFDGIDVWCKTDTVEIAVPTTGCEDGEGAVFTSGSETETVDLPKGDGPTGSLVKSKESGVDGRRGMVSLVGVVGGVFLAMLAL